MRLGRDPGAAAPASEFALGRIAGIAGDARGFVVGRIAAAQDAAALQASLQQAARQGDTLAARLDAEAGSGTPTTFLDRAARGATHNDASNEVVLGRYSNTPASYDAVARARGSTYFSMGDWNMVAADIGEENMWSINRAFLDQQIAKGKEFLFTADPRLAQRGSYTARELDYIIDKTGYSLTKR